MKFLRHLVTVRGAYTPLGRLSAGSLARLNRIELSQVMPELSRFFGIIIRMYREAGEPHHRAHFHAYYQEHVAIYAIQPIEVIAGSLPQRQRRLVEAWAGLHQDELLRDWNLLLVGHRPSPIEPLS